MAIELPPLPYAEDALDPHISARTISFHYGKHHAAYVTNLNGLVEGTPNANQTLEEILLAPSPTGRSTMPRRSGTTRFTGTR